MKYLFIANPIAGRGRTKKILNQVRDYLELKSIDYKLIETSHSGEINSIIKREISNFDRIIVIGGDGTIHELINSEQIKDKTLGVLPTGSGNDFAMTLGFKQNLKIDLNTILDRKVLELDIGYAEITEFSGRKFSFLFANSLGIGFDAEVAASVKKIRFFRGLFLYLLGVFKTLIAYKYRNVKLETTEVKLNEKVFMISIGNGKTAGGGFKLTPLANPLDGYLDVCIVKKISKLKVLQILPLAIIGKHIKNKSVLYLQSKNININSNEPVYVHSDGEIISDQMKSIQITVFNKYAQFLSDGVAYANEKT